MELLFLTHNMNGLGGSYARSFSLAREIVRFGHNVTLLAGRRTPGLEVRTNIEQGVLLVEMPDLLPSRVRHGGLSPIDTLGRMGWCLNKRFDVIQVFDHRPAAFFPAWLARQRRGGLLVSDWADLWGRDGIAGQASSLPRKLLGEFDHIFEQRVRTMADGVTAITSDLDRRAAEMDITRDRRLVLPPGASVDQINMMDMHEARRRLGLPQAAHIAAFSGFAPYDQGFRERSVLELLQRDPATFVISSGSASLRLGEMAFKSGLGERLIQYGTLPWDRMGEVLGAADVLMLPYLDSSINRGRFPNKFGDYLSAGRAIITHATGDLGALAIREQVAILSSENPHDFVSDILELFKAPDRLQMYGTRAREFAEREWSWALRASQLLDFYKRLQG